MSESRDKILKALRDVPGVIEEVCGTKGSIFRRRITKVHFYQSGALHLVIDDTFSCNVTLADAIAVLTPPAEPKPPTYEFVAGLPGAETNARSSVLFRNRNGRLMGFRFNTEGLIAYAVFGDEDLATPQTEPEVLATLRMCRVEVGG